MERNNVAYLRRAIKLMKHALFCEWLKKLGGSCQGQATSHALATTTPTQYPVRKHAANIDHINIDIEQTRDRSCAIKAHFVIRGILLYRFPRRSCLNTEPLEAFSLLFLSSR